MGKIAKSIAKEFVVLSPDKSATVEQYDSELYFRLDSKYDGFKGHELISSFEFSENWSSWEMHPNGDEVVILLSGKVTFVLRHEKGEERIDLSNTGEYAIVPKGVWHTAKTSEDSKMLFITPGEGTRHGSG